MLGMTPKISDEERRLRVTDVISQLYLNNCKTTAIGRLSGGERKRLAFATALLTNPNVVLVDEPTSGLDTYLAKSLMQIIQSMAIKHNQTIVVVLHQPSSIILNIVNKLYLLVEGGQQAFFGDKAEAEEFFRDKCQLLSSSLDGFIEQVSKPSDIIDDQNIISQKIIVQQYLLSQNAKSLEIMIEHHITSSDYNDNIMNKFNVIERNSFLRQFKWLLWRSFSTVKRSSKRTTKLFVRLVFMALMFGAIFFHLKANTNDYIVNLNGLLAILLMPLNESNMSLILVEVPTERKVVIWEYRRQLYSIRAYYLSRLILDTCYHIISSIIFMMIIILLTSISQGFALIGVIILTTMTACSIASFIAAISSRSRTGLLWLQPIQNLTAVFSGYFINLNSIPSYLRWLKYVSYMYYSYRLMLIVQWHHFLNLLSCSRVSSNLFVTNVTSLQLDKCSGTGDDVLQCFNISYQDMPKDILMHFILIFLFHLFAFVITLLRIRRAI